MKPFPLLCISFFLCSSLAAAFTCTNPKSTPCQAIAGYVPPNATTLADLASLFTLPSFLPLLGANNLSLSTPATYPVPANSTIRIPFPCTCSNGTGVSDRIPVYTFKATDGGLDNIARYTFAQFTTYQEIGRVNKLPDVNKIDAGKKLWIPLTCSCDPVAGNDVVHLGHVVPAGSTVAGIAAEFGTTEDVLLRLNGMSSPNMLQAAQVLDVPLKACSSNISRKAVDYGLRVANGSYALTAGNCVQCSCSASSGYELSCYSTQGLNKSECPATDYGGGLNPIINGCDRTTCAYHGYTNASGTLDIMRGRVTNQSVCNAPLPGGSPLPHGGSQTSTGLPGNQMIGLLACLQIAFMLLV